MKSTKEILIVDDLFDNSTVDELYAECQKHFEKNLLFNDDIEITQCIIDCHGLALSRSKYFPYSINCWNILCLKIKKYVSQYCQNFGYDESFIIPFSCWAERSATEMDLNSVQKLSSLPFETSRTYANGFDCFNDSPQKVFDQDGQVKKHFLRSVYNLHSPDPFFGTTVFFDYGERKISSKQNRLLIYDGGSYRSTHYYPKKGLDVINFENCLVGKYNIIFDWYINDPFDVPDWILP